MKPSEVHAATRQAVHNELFLLGHRNLPVTGVGHSLLSILTVLAARHTVDDSTLGWWLGYMLVIGMLYGFEHWNFRSYARSEVSEPRELKRWRIHRQTLQLFSSAGWGGLGFLLVPGAEVHNILIMTAFTGVVGYSAAGNTANDVRGFALSATAASGILVSQIATTFGKEAAVLSAMVVLYSLVLTIVVKNTSAAMRESIRLRIANQVLAAENARHASLAEKANRDKSEFLAAASHDLRQPVHALLLLIEAYRQSEPGAISHPLMQQIAAAGQSINTLFNALMELSRLESGTERVTPERLDLPALMHAVMERFQPEAMCKGLNLRLRVAPVLQALQVRSDKVLLERILGNLLSNALRYTRRGGVLLSLRRAPGDDGFWLEVRDTGKGIAPADQLRIFDPYVQIGNPERDRTKGLGLGLAIVHQAAQLLGFSLYLKSRLQHGSCFRLQIPATMAITPEAHVPNLCALSECSTYRVVLRGRRVLFIDDDAMVLQAMHALLLGWGMDLRSCNCSDDSVFEVCDEHWQPECIISDFRLPGERNGVELLDCLLERYPRAVGILQTGELAQNIQGAAEDAGYLVLFKPVHPDVLSATLGAVLERRSKERES